MISLSIYGAHLRPTLLVSLAPWLLLLVMLLLLLLPLLLLLLLMLQQTVIGRLVDHAGALQSGFTRLVSSR